MFALGKEQTGASKEGVDRWQVTYVAVLATDQLLMLRCRFRQMEATIDQFAELRRSTIKKLEGIQDTEANTPWSPAAFSPKALMSGSKTHPNAKLVAGGADLALEVSAIPSWDWNGDPA